MVIVGNEESDRVTREEVVALAEEDSREAIDVARASDEAITFITGNSMMPPLRAFGHAEYVWQASEWVQDDSESLWDIYVATFDKAMDDARVLCDAPDYDNALYVVDLTRWEYDDESDSWGEVATAEAEAASEATEAATDATDATEAASEPPRAIILTRAQSDAIDVVRGRVNAALIGFDSDERLTVLEQVRGFVTGMIDELVAEFEAEAEAEAEEEEYETDEYETDKEG